MSNEPDQKEMHKALLANLVMMLSTSAMQALGKLVNPATRKAEVSLDGAQVMIDMLEMLKAKTKGNLDADEDNMLSSTLSTLQMNYFDVAQQPGAAPAEPAEPSDAKPAAEPQVEAAGDANKNDPKYHKSYG